jgi:hypothetical protein
VDIFQSYAFSKIIELKGEVNEAGMQQLFFNYFLKAK